jgi:hypothetical protein
MGSPGYYLMSAPARYQTGVDGGPQDFGSGWMVYPQATDKGLVAMAPLGWKADAGWTTERLVRYAWP